MPTFNIDQYLAHIGLKNGKREPNLNFLTDIVTHHLGTFYYQNTQLYFEVKKPPEQRQETSIAVDDLFQQMVINKTPGYCLQNLELLRAALIHLGFKTNRFLTKVIHAPLAELKTVNIDQLYFSHEILGITFEDTVYLVDTGFGNSSLRGPLEFKSGEQAIKEDIYRLVPLGENNWRLDSKVRQKNDWLCLYQFSQIPVNEDKIRETNKNLFFADSIPIQKKLLLSKVTEKKRKSFVFFSETLTGFYKSQRHDETIKRETKFTSLEEAIPLVEEKFNIKFPTK
jgi:arylamine N-acetyltransferase